MDRSVLVYSPDAIRCQIISKTLATKGFEPTSCTTHFEAQAAAATSDRPAAVLDFAMGLSRELDFRQQLAKNLRQSTILVLTTPQDTPILDQKPVPNEIHLPVPLDPDLVHMCLQDAVSGRRGGDAKGVAGVSPGDGQTPPPRRLSRLWDALKKRTLRACRKLFKITLLSILISGAVAVGALLWCFSELPDVGILKMYTPYKASQVYSRDNALLSEFYVERRYYLPGRQIPELVKNAVIAVEDQRYMRHWGVDPIRIVAALYADIRQGRYAQGASTITQQLAKMVFLTPEKTITRKIKEILLSLKIESMYTKTEILELYLNKAYFGPQSYGIATASASYFRKEVKDLLLPEAALLAGLLKAPSDYSPFKNPDRARKGVIRC